MSSEPGCPTAEFACGDLAQQQAKTGPIPDSPSWVPSSPKNNPHTSQLFHSPFLPKKNKFPALLKEKTPTFPAISSQIHFQIPKSLLWKSCASCVNVPNL